MKTLSGMKVDLKGKNPGWFEMFTFISQRTISNIWLFPSKQVFWRVLLGATFFGHL